MLGHWNKEIPNNMKSESLYLQCGSCGNLNKKSLACCSTCGNKLKKSKKKLYICLSLLVLFFVIIVCSNDIPSNETTPNTSSSGAQEKGVSELPNNEADFIALSDDVREKFVLAKNELQKSALRDERKKQLQNMKLTKITDWVGTISELDTNNDGKGILSIKLSPNLSVGTWNNELSDIQSNTLIEKNTVLYNSLLNMNVGQKVIFSGIFFPSDEDAVQEKSMTINGSLSEPEFLFKFKSIKPM